MDLKSFLSIIIALMISATAYANDSLVGDLFSMTSEVQTREATTSKPPPPGLSEQPDSQESLNFFNQGPLNPTDSETTKPLGKTTIHFLTGIDVDRLSAPVDFKKQFEGVEIPMSVLIYEKCTHTGAEEDARSACEWRYSSGFTSKLTRHETQSDGTILSHMIITETNREKNWQGRREVLHTTVMEDGKIASETYDITYDLGLDFSEAAEEKAKTREVLRYHYNPSADGKQIKDMSWTKYADTRGEVPRDMEYHAVLKYDQNGNPERGVATKWTTGWKDKVLFDWQSQKDVPDLTSREMWQMWEQWIKNGPTHVFIA